MGKKKSNLIMLAIILAIIGAIWAIEYTKDKYEDVRTMKCIAANSTLIVSKTCDYCYQQKLVLGDSIKYFEIIDVAEHPEVWEQYNLRGVPTWIVDEEKYAGLKTIKQLKEITSC